jgi:hypothetical protein
VEYEMATLQGKEIGPNHRWYVRWLLFKRKKYILPESYTLPVEVTLHGELSVDVQVPALSENSGLPYHIQQPVLLRSRTSAIRYVKRRDARKETGKTQTYQTVKVERTELRLKFCPLISNKMALLDEDKHKIDH